MVLLGEVIYGVVGFTIAMLLVAYAIWGGPGGDTK